MRRDICFYYKEDVITIYNAFLSASQNPPFSRTCSQQPYHTFQFGLNYSMKYNMNGGSLTIHFMPYNNGTAVNMRFSIAQLAGAKCETFANDLAYYACSNLGLRSQFCSVPIEEFLKPENQITPQRTAPSPAPSAAPTVPLTPPPVPAVSNPVQPAYIQPVSQQISNTKRCKKCGATMALNAKFCTVCGTSSANPNGEWTCTCGRTHLAYVTSCSCGQSKRSVLNPTAAQPAEAAQQVEKTPVSAAVTDQTPAAPAAAPSSAAVDESAIISTLRQYKELLDSGIITQEEFDLKKKSLLSR